MNDQAVAQAVLAIVGLTPEELATIAEHLTVHFPERANELEFLLWTAKADICDSGGAQNYTLGYN